MWNSLQQLIKTCFYFFSSPQLSANPFPHLPLHRKCRVISHEFPQFSSLLPPSTCLKGQTFSIALILISPFYASSHTLLHQLSLSSSQYIVNSRKILSTRKNKKKE
jgi:hypothetical protein